jgi:hypothetical protein
MKFLIKSNHHEYANYFQRIPEFSLLPEFYQNRIVSFFIEERHYMVDPSDVKCFLDKGKRFEAFMTVEELIESSRAKSIKKILGCKRHFASLDSLCGWLDKLHEGIECDEIWFLTHSMGFEFDEPEEWYIARY